MFAAQTFDTVPDIICMGKGMSSGYAPVGGIAYPGFDRPGVSGQGRTADPVQPRAHFRRQPAVQRRRDREHQRNQGEGTSSKSKRIRGDCLEALRRDERKTRDHRGHPGEGTVNRDRIRHGMSKQSSSSRRAWRSGCRSAKPRSSTGLIIRADSHWVAVAPPLIIEKDEIDVMMDRLSESIEEVLARVGR